MFELPSLPKLKEAIKNPSNPIGMRMRAAYFLRQMYENSIRNEDSRTEEEIKTEKKESQIVIEILGEGLEEVKHGSLMRHEFAYVMGQLRDERVRALCLINHHTVLRYSPR